MDGRDFRDVTILYAKENEDWCSFLQQSFMTEQTKLKVEHLNVSNLDYRSPPEIQVSLHESHVVILLITDALLTYMESNADWFTTMLKSRDPVLTSIFAVYLCVEHEDVLNLGVNFSYDLDAWDEFELSSDGSNKTRLVSRVLDFVDTNGYRLFRKRKMCQKRAEMTHQGVQLMPTSAPRAGEKAALIFSEEVNGQLTVHLEDPNSEPLESTQANPYCITFITPEISNQGTQLIVKKDDQIKFQIPWSSCCQVCQFSSIELLCQAHGVSTINDLDLTLTQKFQGSQCSQVNSLTEYLRDNVELEPVKTTYPSMLHWAAAHGLQELVAAILSTAAGSSLGRVVNNEGLDPETMARSNGHVELADFIAQTLETEAIAEACKIYVERVCGQGETKAAEEEQQPEYETMTPSPLQSPPESSDNTTFSPFNRKVMTPSPHQHTPSSSANTTPSPSNRPSSSSTARPFAPITLAWASPRISKDLPSPKFKFPPPPVKKKPSREPELSTDATYEEVDLADVATDPTYQSPDPSQYIQPSGVHADTDQHLYLEPDWILPDGAMGSRSQGELINIQRDVKSGAFTVTEAERLYKSWVDRHGVGNNQSFKDKMATLKSLRDEYGSSLSTIRETGAKPKKETRQPRVSNPFNVRSPTGSVSDAQQRDNRFSKASETSNGSNDSGIAASDDTESKRSSKKDMYLKLLEETPEATPERPPALPPRKKGGGKTETLPARLPSQQPLFPPKITARTYSKKAP